MEKSLTAHDLVAWAIINCNVPLSLEQLYSLSTSDPLYVALIQAYKDRERKTDARVGLICAILANVMGSGKKQYTPDDFMPHEPKSAAQQDAEIKANLQKFGALKAAGRIRE